jgi:hypothetical protein
MPSLPYACKGICCHALVAASGWEGFGRPPSCFHSLLHQTLRSEGAYPVLGLRRTGSANRHCVDHWVWEGAQHSWRQRQWLVQTARVARSLHSSNYDAPAMTNSFKCMRSCYYKGLACEVTLQSKPPHPLICIVLHPVRPATHPGQAPRAAPTAMPAGRRSCGARRILRGPARSPPANLWVGGASVRQAGRRFFCTHPCSPRHGSTACKSQRAQYQRGCGRLPKGQICGSLWGFSERALPMGLVDHLLPCEASAC